MNMYLYRLWDFNFQEEDDEYPYYYENAHLVETKLTTVLPMAYGYFNIGMNYVEIFPYYSLTFPAKPILIFAEKEQESPDGYALLVPYQAKAMAKKIFSEWLEFHGYEKAAKAVKTNSVTKLKRMSAPITNEDVSYAKRWDKVKVAERNALLYEALAERT